MSIPQEIETLVSRWVALQRCGDAAGCAYLYSEDGVINSFAAPIKAHGRKEIEAMHRSWLEAGEINQRIAIHDARVEGDLGYFLAEWRGDIPRGDGFYKPVTGVILSVLKRRADGLLQFRASSLTLGTLADTFLGLTKMN